MSTILTYSDLRRFLEDNGMECQIFPVKPTTGRRWLILFPNLPWWAWIRRNWQEGVKERMVKACPPGWVFIYSWDDALDSQVVVVPKERQGYAPPNWEPRAWEQENEALEKARTEVPVRPRKECFTQDPIQTSFCLCNNAACRLKALCTKYAGKP